LLPNIILRELGDVHGCDIYAGILPCAIPVVAKVQTVKKMLSVRVLKDDRA
jgi:hypothetical protein